MVQDMKTRTVLSHKERVERILGGKEIDHPAISIWRHFYNLENTREGLVAAMIEFQRKYDWDFMKINPRASYHIEDWGAIMQKSNDPLIKPTTIRLPVHNKNDWARIRLLDWRSGALGEALAATKDIVEQIGADVYIVQTIFSPLSIAADMVNGEARFVELLREGPSELHTALEAITETFIGFTRELIKTGVAGIFFATTEVASRNLLTEEEYLEFGRNYDLKVLRAAGTAAFNVLHVCNKNNMLPLFRDYPIDVISWNPFDEGNLSIHQAAQILNKVFLTGIDQNITLLSGSVKEITNQIEDSLKQMPSGRLMLGPGCAIKVGTPEDRLRNAIQAVKGWKY
jgi:uroporphyrinogen decarboxylase